MNAIEHLRQVMAVRGTTTIIYLGGSAPGMARAIAPIDIQGDMLIARCLETNKRKTFAIEKVRIVRAEAITPYPKRATDNRARLEQLDAMGFQPWLSVTAERLRAAGWNVRSDPAALLAVRGEDRHSLAHEPRLQGIFFDADGKRMDAPLSERPWHMDGRLYTHMSHALAAFEDATGLTGEVADHVDHD